MIVLWGEPPPRAAKGVNRRQDGVFERFPCVGRDNKVISPSHVVDLVHPAMPVPPRTTSSRPSSTILLMTGEMMPPWGTPAVVGRGCRDPKSHFEAIGTGAVGMGMCCSSHGKAM